MLCHARRTNLTLQSFDLYFKINLEKFLWVIYSFLLFYLWKIFELTVNTFISRAIFLMLSTYDMYGQKKFIFDIVKYGEHIVVNSDSFDK